jgi:hypothetical protein
MIDHLQHHDQCLTSIKVDQVESNRITGRMYEHYEHYEG